MSERLDKYDLNKNWGVPFEVEKQLETEVSNAMNDGIWIAVQELVYCHDYPSVAREILKNAGFTREECDGCQERSGTWDDEMYAFIEQYF